MAADVEDHVVAMVAGREVIAGVVDDVIGAEGSNQIDLGGTAHTSDFRTESLGDLNGKRANAARRADDQHLLPRLHVRLADGLQRGTARDGDGRGLRER